MLVVPIGGGGLISGIAMAAKAIKPSIRVIGVESSGAPGMQRSVQSGEVVTLDREDFERLIAESAATRADLDRAVVERSRPDPVAEVA